MRKLLFIVLMLLVASTSLAREISPLKTDLVVPAATRYDGDCVVGNNDLASIAGYYDSWFYGFENYAVPFNAADEGCACAEGTAVKSIHMLLTLDPFADLNVAAAVLEAVDDGTGCLVPGMELAVSATVNVTGITVLDYYDIEIPIDGPCATANDALFLAIYFLDDNGSQLVGLPITDPATLCFNYNDFGSGYVDITDAYGFSGDLLIWADVDCCGDPVETEASTLGSIKSLYR